MKTPEQLKGAIRSMAAKKNLRAQEVLQMFLFERIIERLAVSSFRNNFILKGGLLISSMIGIGERTTMDMDTTVRGIQMEEDEIVAAVKQIISTDVNDGISFEYEKSNRFERRMPIIISCTFAGKIRKIDSPMKIDVTTGDIITPAAIQYDFPLIFDEKTVSIMAYTLETVLAEKYETIIRRNIGTTRARDFYDLHTLFRSRKEEINVDILRMAVIHTAQKRESVEDIRDWKAIIKDIREEPQMYLLWDKYIVENKYIGELEFHQVLDTVDEVANLLAF